MSSKLYKVEWKKFYDEYREFFHSPLPDIDISAYLQYFNGKFGPLIGLSHPSFYKLEVLKSFADKLVCARFVPDQRFGQRFMLLFQFSAEMHAEASISWSTRGNVLICSPFQVHAKNLNDSIEFFKSVSIYEHDEEQERKVGFA